MPAWPGRPTKHLLHSVADNFASDTTRPADNGRLVEAFALPPWRVSAGRVHGDFETARQGLAELIARHEQTLAM